MLPSQKYPLLILCFSLLFTLLSCEGDWSYTVVYPPPHIKSALFKKTSLFMTWSMQQVEDVLFRYNLSWHNKTTAVTQTLLINPSNVKTGYEITNLTPGHVYEVKIQAYYEKDFFGPWSHVIKGTVGKPTEVQNFTLNKNTLEKNNWFLELAWQKNEENTKKTLDIDAYEVACFNTTLENPQPIFTTVTSSTTYEQRTNTGKSPLVLKPGTYDCVVTVRTSAGIRSDGAKEQVTVEDIEHPTFSETRVSWGTPITFLRSSGHRYQLNDTTNQVVTCSSGCIGGIDPDAPEIRLEATAFADNIRLKITRDGYEGKEVISKPITFTRQAGALTFANRNINKVFDPLNNTYQQEATRGALDDTGAIRYIITSTDGGNASIADDGTVTFTKTGTYTITAMKAESLKYTEAEASYVLRITTFVEVLSTRWSARDSFQAVEFQNKLYVMGGSGSHGFLNDIWSTEDGQNWTQVTVSGGYWSARDSFQAVVFKNKLYVMGGRDNTGRVNDIWSTEDGSSWTQVTVSGGYWGARSDFQAVEFQNKLYVMGGFDNRNTLNDIWSTEDGSSWTQVTVSGHWNARYDFQSVVFKNRLYVMGGTRYKRLLNDIWSTENGQNWTQVTVSGHWSARDSFQAVEFKNKLYVMGGSGSHGFLNDIWSTGDGQNWTRVTVSDGHWGVRSSFQAVEFDNKLYVMGGYGNTGRLDDVWTAAGFP